MPTMLFSGYMANLDTIVKWLVWLQYISPMRYSMEILFRNEYREVDFVGNENPLNPYPVDGYSLTIGMTMCFISTVIIGAAFMVGSYIFLKLQTSRV